MLSAHWKEIQPFAAEALTLNAYKILEGHGLLLWRDDGALNQEFVFALDIQRRLLLHSLKHD